MVKRKVSAFIRILHLPEWIKNLFIAAPIIYASDFFNPHSVLQVFFAILFFCLATSTVYIVNDVLDIEQDKHHPVKKLRPLPAGELSVREALFIVYLFYALLLIGIFVVPNVMLTIIGYIIINYFYSLRLKRFFYIGSFIIAIGMVLRVYAGSLAIAAPYSPWVFFITLSYGVMLGAVRCNLDMPCIDGPEQEQQYHTNFKKMHYLALLMAACTSVFYTIFTALFEPWLAITVPFVLFGVYRYLYLVYANKNYDSVISPILRDIPTMLSMLIWFAITLYFQWPR